MGVKSMIKLYLFLIMFFLFSCSDSGTDSVNNDTHPDLIDIVDLDVIEDISAGYDVMELKDELSRDVFSREDIDNSPPEVLEDIYVPDITYNDLVSFDEGPPDTFMGDVTTDVEYIDTMENEEINLDTGLMDVGYDIQTEDTAINYTLTITEPKNNSSFPVNTPVHFAGTTNCYPSTISFVADNKYTMGSTQSSDGSFSFTYSFNTAGQSRLITATANGNICSASDSVTISITKPEPDNPIDVPYFCQYENELYPSSSCQNTSIAMVLSFYGWSGIPDDITSEWGKDYAQSPDGLAEVFNYYSSKAGLGVTLTPRTSGTFAGIKSLIDKGRPVIVHGYFTQYGHVVVIVGYDATGYFVNDPAGQWSQVYQGGYSKYCDYGYSGKSVHYSKSAFEQAIGPDGTIWYHEPSR